MTNVNQASLPRLVRASLVKRRYIKYLALPSTKSEQQGVDQSFEIICSSSDINRKQILNISSLAET